MHLRLERFAPRISRSKENESGAQGNADIMLTIADKSRNDFR